MADGVSICFQNSRSRLMCHQSWSLWTSSACQEGSSGTRNWQEILGMVRKAGKALCKVSHSLVTDNTCLDVRYVAME